MLKFVVFVFVLLVVNTIYRKIAAGKGNVPCCEYEIDYYIRRMAKRKGMIINDNHAIKLIRLIAITHDAKWTVGRAPAKGIVGITTDAIEGEVGAWQVMLFPIEILTHIKKVIKKKKLTAEVVYSYTLSILHHEKIHMKQYREGRLKSDNPTIDFEKLKKDKLQMLIAYWNNPLEQEAHRGQYLFMKN